MSNYDSQRYYWIKLSDHFMTSDTVDFLMEQTDGANYIVLYQMLCLKTINNGGELSRKIGEVIIPYDVEKIQRDTKWFSIDTVRVALDLYQRLGLIYVKEDGNLQIANFENLIGSETHSAQRMRETRRTIGEQSANNRRTISEQSANNRRTIGEHCSPDKDKEIDKDKDKEKDTELDNPPHNPPKGRDGASADEKKALSERFDRFYTAYPRKQAKQEAIKAWGKLKPDEDLLNTMLSAIEKQKRSDQWTKDNGAYIPLPATWINGHRWEDELAAPQSRYCEEPISEEWENFEFGRGLLSGTN